MIRVPATIVQVASSESPSYWGTQIVWRARKRRSPAILRHIVGAVLEQCHPGIQLSNRNERDVDVATSGGDDFKIGSTCYHVTAAPGSDLITNCAANLDAGLHPVLLVPRDQVAKARHLAEDQRVDARVTIAAIEDFIALNIIELSVGDQQKFAELLKSIVEKYNRRLEEVETDMSLRIELH